MSVSPTWASDLVVEDENGGGTGGVVTVVESKEPEAPASRRGSCAGDAACGVYFQVFLINFSVPWYLNIVLWPFGVANEYIKWAVTSN